MVLKVGKFGIRSGNTFKASNSKFLRQYRKQSLLIRTRTLQNEEGEANAREIDEIVAREDIRSDHVAYSLNKKARWQVPALIKEVIDNGEQDCGIQLIESHKVLKKANRIGVYTTHAPSVDGSFTKVAKRKKRGYLHERSVLHASPDGSRQQRRRRMRQGHPVEEEGPGMVFEQPSMVRYDVVYPSPISSSVTHNPRYIGHETKKPEDARIPRGSRRRVRLNVNLHEELEAFDDEIDFDITDDEADVYDDDMHQREINYDIVLADLLYYAKAATKLAKFKTHSRNPPFSDKDVETKGRVIYEEPTHTAADEDETESKDTKKIVVEEKPIDTTLNPVHVLLPNEQVDPYNLRARFQDECIECDCFPRKFVLNISRRVSDLASLRNNSQLTNAFIVFEYDVGNESNSRHESVYKIMFNSNFAQSVKCIKIETLFDYIETNIDEIIDRTCFFVETLKEGTLQTERSVQTRQHDPERVDQIMKWKTKSYKPTCRHYIHEFLSTTKEAIADANSEYTVVSWFDADTSDDGGDVSSPVGRCCCVCYATIDKEDSGTAIIACGHWACNACWRQYLKSKMNSMATCLILCPEFDCNRKVDPGTILSLVNFRYILKLAKRCHDTKVDQHDDELWCPKIGCGRVMKVTSSEAMSALCTCGEKVCVRCLAKDHYPAPCSTIEDYHKRLKNSGDDGIVPLEGMSRVIVQGKVCPHCKAIVEKKGGCPYMVCICGRSFCWGCGRKYETGVVHGSTCRVGENDSHNTSPVELRDVDLLRTRKRERWYHMAVTHRVNQHPLKVCRMRANSSLVRQVQRYMSLAAKRGDPVDLQFEGSGKNVYLCETDKVSDFLKSTIQLYSEMNHLVEYCALLIESDVLSEGARYRLLYAVKRLSTFAKVLFTLFTNEQSPKYLIEQLVQVRQRAFTCINAISRNATQVQEK